MSWGSDEDGRRRERGRERAEEGAEDRVMDGMSERRERRAVEEPNASLRRALLLTEHNAFFWKVTALLALSRGVCSAQWRGALRCHRPKVFQGAASARRNWPLPCNLLLLRFSSPGCLMGLEQVLATGGDDRKVNIWALGKPNAIMSLR